MTTESKINILVIDDNPDQLNWFKILNTPDSPYSFYTLQNEANAVQALDKIKPKLVFLDMSLNVLDGPLIATILNGNDIDNEHIIPMSADGKAKKSVNSENFLQKPLTKDAVFNKIKEVLKL